MRSYRIINVMVHVKVPAIMRQYQYVTMMMIKEVNRFKWTEHHERRFDPHNRHHFVNHRCKQRKDDLDGFQ